MKKKINKTYSLIGQVLCGIAGGIVGFIFGGPVLAILGVVVGAVGGHILEKAVLNPSLTK